MSDAVTLQITLPRDFVGADNHRPGGEQRVGVDATFIGPAHLAEALQYRPRVLQV